MGESGGVPWARLEIELFHSSRNGIGVWGVVFYLLLTVFCVCVCVHVYVCLTLPWFGSFNKLSFV